MISWIDWKATINYQVVRTHGIIMKLVVVQYSIDPLDLVHTK
jgi:hypothetical protein